MPARSGEARKGGCRRFTVGVKRVQSLLGRKAIQHDKKLECAQPGVVTGLAWTRAGGEILFIETSAAKGDGKLCITGSWEM